jgi:hypothetical protein
MRIAPFSSPGRFWRGNLHTHSHLSDGALSPEQVIESYKRAGYDFLQLSEHFLERFGWPIADTRAFCSNSFTTLIGAELQAMGSACRFQAFWGGRNLSKANSQHIPIPELGNKMTHPAGLRRKEEPSAWRLDPRHNSQPTFRRRSRSRRQVRCSVTISIRNPGPLSEAKLLRPCNSAIAAMRLRPKPVPAVWRADSAR